MAYINRTLRAQGQSRIKRVNTTTSVLLTLRINRVQINRVWPVQRIYRPGPLRDVVNMLTYNRLHLSLQQHAVTFQTPLEALSISQKDNTLVHTTNFVRISSVQMAFLQCLSAVKSTYWLVQLSGPAMDTIHGIHQQDNVYPIQDVSWIQILCKI